jgi:LacI family transcriptional regulator
VRAETRERVRQAAIELGYQPNFHARRLRRSRASVLGLLVPDYQNPGFAEIIAGAEEVAGERDVVLWTSSSDGYPRGRRAALFRSGMVDALLIAGARTGDDPGELIRDGPPVLLVNRRIAGLDRWIVLEDERAAGMATERLIAAGHRRIAFIGGTHDLDTAARRYAGYLAALEGAGITPDPRLRAFGEYTPDGGATALRQILDSTRLPTAVVVAHGLAGFGVWHALHERGFQVPRDMSIIGINRLPHESYRVPSMTRVELPLKALGRRAAELVLDLPPTEPIHETLVGAIALVEGDTVAPPAR